MLTNNQRQTSAATLKEEWIITDSKSVTTSFVPIDRVVIVGASLAGLRAAEALRNEGFTGHLTLIGDEPWEPYDRPPLSKSVLTGWLPIDHTTLPQLRDIQAEWILGVADYRAGPAEAPGAFS